VNHFIESIWSQFTHQILVSISNIIWNRGSQDTKCTSVWVHWEYFQEGRCDLLSPLFKLGNIRWSQPPQLAWSWGCGLCMCSSNRNATAMCLCLQMFPRLTATPQISHIPPKECLVFLLFDLVTVGGRRWERNGGGLWLVNHVHDSQRVSSTLRLTHRMGNVWSC